jgi:TRAP-type transport system small permease protein
MGRREVLLGWTGRVDTVSRWIIVATMSAMAVMVSLQVFWRYVLGSSIDSADEVSRLLFVWVIFLSIPHGVKYSIHVGIDLLVVNLPPSIRDPLYRIVAAASVLLMAAVSYSALVATMDKWQEMMPTLAISAGVYYIPVLISAIHSTLHLLLLARYGRNLWNEHPL